MMPAAAAQAALAVPCAQEQPRGISEAARLTQCAAAGSTTALIFTHRTGR